MLEDLKPNIGRNGPRVVWTNDNCGLLPDAGEDLPREKAIIFGAQSCDSR